MWVRGHSRLLKLVAFESMGTVSYSHSTVTMNYGAILYRLRDVTYWSKIAEFLYLTGI